VCQSRIDLLFANGKCDEHTASGLTFLLGSVSEAG
jgi:hypothetical protein